MGRREPIGQSAEIATEFAYFASDM